MPQKRAKPPRCWGKTKARKGLSTLKIRGHHADTVGWLAVCPSTWGWVLGYSTCLLYSIVSFGVS